MRIEKWLLRLYPRVWRTRYEEEVLALLEVRSLSSVHCLEMILEALDAHLHPQFGTRGMPVSERVAHLFHSLRGSLLAVFCSYISFVVAGLAFQHLAEGHAFIMLANTYPLIDASFSLIILGSIIALLAIIIGGLPIVWTVVKEAFATKQMRLLLLLAVPFLALAVLLSTIQVLGHTFAGQHSETISRTIFVSVFLTTAGMSTASVCVAVTRSPLARNVLRFAIFPSAIATIAMLVMLIGTFCWGISIQSTAPSLFAGHDGLVGSSTILTWLGILITMTIATSIAISFLIRSLSVRSVLHTIS